MERFAVFRHASRPVLLRGLLDDAARRDYWSLPSLRQRFADHVVSVIPTKDGRISLDVQTGVDFETVRFGDYLGHLERGDHLEAYVVAPADTWMPELNDGVRPPEYCRDAAWRNSRFWFGPARTSVPLHRDVAENIFFQLMGRKRFFIYAPAASAWLYSNPFRSALPNFSRFDPEAPDYERFPLSREVQPLEVVLEPGDALYLPSRWWHQVRSLDVSASFSFWFADGVLAEIVRAAEFVKRVRGLEIYRLEARRAKHGELAAR